MSKGKNRLGLGSGSLHHLFWGKDRLDLINTAYDLGFRHFDTSPYYGSGLAERSLGHALHAKRSEVRLATKVGLYGPSRYANSISIRARIVAGKVVPRLSKPIVDWTIAKANESFVQSLKRLRTDFVDYLFLHEPEISIINCDEYYGWLESLRSKGMLIHWGVAGVQSAVEPFVAKNSPLADVVQTKDSIEKREGDFLQRYGRDMEFSYGYLSSSANGLSAIEVLRKAQSRNTKGTILVSTRRKEKLTDLMKSAS